MRLKLFGLMTVLSATLISSVHAAELPSFETMDHDADAEAFFRHFPQTETVRLGRGDEIKLPAHFTDTEAAIIVGTADFDVLRAFLKSESLMPFRLPLTNKGLVYMTVTNAVKNTFGPYREVAVHILLDGCKNNLLENSRSTDPQKVMEQDVMTWGMWTDSNLTLRASQEIWGLPAKPATFITHFTRESLAFQMKDESEAVLMEGHLSTGKLSLRLPMSLKLNTVTPIANKRTVTPFFMQGEFFVSAITGEREMTYNDATVWGRKLKLIGFKPLLLQYSPSFFGAMIAPQQP